MSKDKTILNTSEITALVQTSRRNVEHVKKGIEIKDDTVAHKIRTLLEFDTLLKELFLDPDFYEMCEVAIMKARKASVRKFAVHCQHASESARYKLGITETDRTESEG